ncbi:MAG: thiamine phosphate synthase [Gammaproteobacteria bacterium]|nr:thiamine phosphate synthase [Gammaproteobacteria bacterium]
MFEERLAQAAARDALLLQLREPWPASRLRAYAQHLRALLAPYGGRCIVNGDPNELMGCADGIHLPASHLARIDARPAATDGCWWRAGPKARRVPGSGSFPVGRSIRGSRRARP